MRRLHPSDAGTVGQVNIPPDPGDIHRYVEFPTLESQDEEGHMQQDEANTDIPLNSTNTLAEDAMSQGTDQDSGDTSTMSVHNAQSDNNNEDGTRSGLVDVNGGIDDDDLLDMMAKDATAIHTITATDTSPEGPYGSREEKC